MLRTRRSNAQSGSGSNSAIITVNDIKGECRDRNDKISFVVLVQRGSAGRDTFWHHITPPHVTSSELYILAANPQRGEEPRHAAAEALFKCH